VLLANKADVNLPTGTGSDQERPLHRAVEGGRTNLIQLLIQHGADVNVTNWLGETPLEYAAAKNDTNAARLLLAAKAAIDAKNNNGNTPLHEAADRGNTAMVSLLLNSGATVGATNNNGDSPLLLAVNQAKADVTRVLLEHKADPNCMGWLIKGGNRGQYTPAFLAIPHPEILKLLLDAGAKPGLDLHWAIEECQPDSVRLLLEHGADPNYRWPDDTLPISQAINKCKAAIPILLDKGADPNGRNQRGTPLFTPLFQTADPEIGRWLVAHKADVNAREEAGQQRTPLMAQIYYTNYVEFLIEAGAGIDLQDTNGNTALHYAVRLSRPDAVAILLAHKANPNIQNDMGYTPLDLAKSGSSSGRIEAGMWTASLGWIGVTADKEKESVDLLMQAGGLANLPKRNLIEVRRGLSTAFTIRKDSPNRNRYSLLESIAIAYGLLGQQSSGEWVATTDTRQSSFNLKLRFPDFKHVVIYKRTDNSAKQIATTVDVENILSTGDCSRDIWLDWGDVVEIPEVDHPVEEQWPGLSDEHIAAMGKCLARQATVKIKGESTALKLAPEFRAANAIPGDSMRTLVHASFMLRSVLDNSKLVRVSSDLSRVKVTRIDPETKKKQEWTIDCTKPSEADLWLRDGDVIDVPEK